MKYTVNTVYGISEGKYFGTDDKPLAGIGQGSGASPSVWLSLRIVLLIAYGNQARKGMMEFQDPTNTIESSRVGDAFVDDMTIGFNTAEISTTAIQSSPSLLYWQNALNCENNYCFRREEL